LSDGFEGNLFCGDLGEAGIEGSRRRLELEETGVFDSK
jgi:hypothetical protein